MARTLQEVRVTRTERAKRICRFLADRIAQEVPEGLGRWDVAWSIVEQPSTQFLEALHDWEQTGSADAERRLHDARDLVLNAWREAARQWSAQRNRNLARTA